MSITNNKSQITNHTTLRVLFVASGNKVVGQVNSFVRSQYESLKDAGLNMLLFPVVGHGTWAHIKAAWQLRKQIRRERPDIVHAHYSIYGYVSWLASIGLCHRPKIVVSILGSFPTHSKKWRLVRYCIQHLWDGTLVKSERTRSQLGLDLPIIPNGVNLNIFHPVSESERAELRQCLFGEEELSPITNHQSPITNNKYIIWCSNLEREEKNWPLAQKAVEILKSQITNHQSPITNHQSPITNHKSQIKLVPVYNKTPQEVAEYMNAADCLLLTSMSEGSPNVIKEAMACNCPIVTTDVGDVQERLSITNHQSQITNNTYLPGCYVSIIEHKITSSATHRLYHTEIAQDIARLLGRALTFGQRTKGYERILQDGLTIEKIAEQIIQLYNNLLFKRL